MLHAKMMPLLADVYKGRIANEQARLGEYGGQKLEAQVVEGGVRFAAVNHVRSLFFRVEIHSLMLHSGRFGIRSHTIPTRPRGA